MTWSRWPGVVVLVGLVVGAYAVDQDHEREVTEPADAATPLEAQGYLPVAAPGDAITSTWYCPGGTVGEADVPVNESLTDATTTPAPGEDAATTTTTVPETDLGGATSIEADTTIVVANAGDGELSGEVTIYPSRGPKVTVDLTVPAADRTVVHLGDEVREGYAAALVEVDGGNVAVEQRVEGPEGADVSPCATQPSGTWFFADGQTTADALELLVFFNPFPDPAVIDVTFRAEDALRTPQEFEGYVVPARSVVVENVDDFVSRREHVSTSVVARTGRLVVNRLQQFDGSVEDRGLDLALGAARPAPSWYFPEGLVTQGVSESYVIYNPGDTTAEVDLVLEVDEVDRIGAIEPFALHIPPEGYEEVVVSDEERVGTALADAEGDDVLRHGAHVVSVNDVPVVAERVVAGAEGSPREGVDLLLGAPLLTEQALLAASARNETLIVQNPSSASPAQITVRTLDGGALSEPSAAVEAPPAGRVLLDLVELGVSDDRPVLIESDRPVAIERSLVIGDPRDLSAAIAVPLAGSVSEPPQRFD